MRAATMAWALLMAVASCAGGSGDSGGAGGGDAPSDGDGAGGDQRIFAACAPHASTGAVTHVDVDVAFNLPPELSVGAGCVGDPALLEGLLVFGAQGCLVDVDSSGVSGCCTDVEADANYNAVLTYRVAASFATLGEQTVWLELPSTSDPVVPLSFTGVAITPDASGNLDAWCAGTL